MKVRDKTIVVTGGGSGIGRQLVLELVRRGARVAAVDIRDENLAETAALAAAGDNVATVVVDVTDREAVEGLPGRVEAALGPVDGYISNAGIIQPFVRIQDLGYDDIDRVIAVNLYGAINMAKAFIPHLVERAASGSGPPPGHLCTVSQRRPAPSSADC